jgi:hypothetical protein
MTNTAISVHNVSRCYYIGGSQVESKACCCACQKILLDSSASTASLHAAAQALS